MNTYRKIKPRLRTKRPLYVQCAQLRNTDTHTHARTYRLLLKVLYNVRCRMVNTDIPTQIHAETEISEYFIFYAFTFLIIHQNIWHSYFDCEWQRK